MIKISDVSYTIFIDRLTKDDPTYATINSNIADNITTDDDVGPLLNWCNLELVNSIIDPTKAISKITLITSNEYNAKYANLISNIDFTSSIDSLNNFLKTLVGRPITVYVNYKVIDVAASSNETEETKTVFVGFITKVPDNINSHGGAKFTLQCKPLIAQLGIISSNSSWQDSTQTYNNVFTQVNSNQLDKSNLLTLIYNGTLLTDLPLSFIDGAAKPLPDKLWAFLAPYRMRYEAITELLTPYSRIFYQEEDGTLVIKPLFYDDYVDDNFNVNATNNLNKNWLMLDSINNSVDLPNRIDVSFGVNSPVPLFNSEGAPIEAFASAPKIDLNTNKIISQSTNDNLDYTQIYSTSSRLYNSGKFTMPQMRTIEIDNALVQNKDGLLNAMFALYGSDALGTSVITNSNNSQYNTIPQLYSQIYLAESNTNAYSALVLYDYIQIINLNSPLGKLINIEGLRGLDYSMNLVTETVLVVDGDLGSMYLVQTAPLLSITGAWFSKDSN